MKKKGKSITENYQRIRKEIPDYVTIVLAGKTKTLKEIEEAKLI